MANFFYFLFWAARKLKRHIEEEIIGWGLIARGLGCIMIRYENKPASAFLEDKIQTDEYFRVAKVSDITEKELLPHIKWAKEKVACQIENYNKINNWR